MVNLACLQISFPSALYGLCISFQLCVLGDPLHMSQPCSLWSLHHLFLNFQYIFSSSSKSCKELAAKLKQEGSSPADKEPILALATVEPQSVARLLEQLLSSAARGAALTPPALQRGRSRDGKLRCEAKVAKLGWPEGGFDALAIQASNPGCLPYPGLQLPFARATGRRLWLP